MSFEKAYKNALDSITDQSLIEEHIEVQKQNTTDPEMIACKGYTTETINNRIKERLLTAFRDAGITELYSHTLYLNKDVLWNLFREAVDDKTVVENTTDITNNVKITEVKEEHCECGGKLAWRSCMLICSNCLKCHAG